MENKLAFCSTLNHLTTSMFHFCGLFNYADYCYGYSTLGQQLDQITVQQKWECLREAGKMINVIQNMCLLIKM